MRYVLALSACASALAAMLAVPPAHANAKHKPAVLYAYGDESDGIEPALGAIGSDGTLYGFTFQGGGQGTCSNGGCGTLFKLTSDGQRTVLHIFSGPDGYEPTGIVRDAQGIIYGTTLGGGKHGYGAVFRYTPGGKFSLLHSFPAPDGHNDAPGGIWPLGGLTLGPDGNLYGSTSNGGINKQCGPGGCGTVFKLTTAGDFTRLYAFTGAGDGCNAYSGVAVDAAGNVYGTTHGCGHGNYGTVFKVDPDGVETVLHVFAEGLDGNDPYSTPILDDAGNLYGTTVFGGGDSCGGTGHRGPGCGILYKIAPDGTETILHAFLGAAYGDGSDPASQLYRDQRGVIYGVTRWGGLENPCNAPIGCGTFFRLTPRGVMTVLHDFIGPDHGDGAFPGRMLIPAQDADGNDVFYSTTDFGPACCGMIFKVGK